MLREFQFSFQSVSLPLSNSSQILMLMTSETHWFPWHISFPVAFTSLGDAVRLLLILKEDFVSELILLVLVLLENERVILI